MASLDACPELAALIQACETAQCEVANLPGPAIGATRMRPLPQGHRFDLMSLCTCLQPKPHLRFLPEFDRAMRFLSSLAVLITTSAPVLATAQLQQVCRLAGDGSFPNIQDLSTGGGAAIVASADLNSDGEMDLVVAVPSADGVLVRLGLGGGDFAPGLVFSTGDSPQFVGVAYLNSDAVPDLFVVNNLSNNVSVLLGLGDGTFNTSSNYSVGALPLSAVAGDFDLDGDVDLAVTGLLSDEIAVLLGAGSGAFGPAQSFSAGDGPWSIATGDLDGDGVLDLVVTNAVSDQVSVLRGLGAGNFAPPIGFHVGAFPRCVVLQDVDQDGTLDVITANYLSDNLTLLAGLGDGGLVAAVTYPVGDGPEWVSISDVDADGVLDLVVANSLSSEVSVLNGIGDGSFGMADVHVAVNPRCAIICDSNGDGARDIVVAQDGQAGSLRLLLGSLYSPALVSGIAGTAAFAILKDVNGDGQTDMVLGTGEVRLSLGGGNFVSSYLPVGASSGDCADLNGDGSLDLVLCSGGDARVLLGAGDGTFGAPSTYSVFSAIRSIALGDLNGDQTPDMVLANGAVGGTGYITVLLGIGGGVFGPSAGYSVPGFPMSVELADLDADGALDVLAGTKYLFGVQVLMGLGDGTLGAPTSYLPALEEIWSLAVGDLDQDGIPDVVAASFDFDYVLTYLGGGDGTLTYSASLSENVSNGPQSVALADVDEDGLLDLVVSYYYESWVSVYLGRGDGGFGPATSYGVASSTRHASVGDVGGDGALDIIAVGASSSLLMDSRVRSSDGFEPNHSCSLAAVVMPGSYEGLVVYRSGGQDFFEISVPDAYALSIDLVFSHASGDIDCFLYNPQAIGLGCGDMASDLARGTSTTDDEHIIWTNSTGAPATYVLQVNLRDLVGHQSCSVYDLVVSVDPPSLGTPICAGDGSLVACPCGNESATSADGCLNSLGVGGKVAASGTNVVLNDDLVLSITQGRPSQPSLLLQGSTLQSAMFKDGVLCLGNPTERVEVVFLDALGSGATTESIVTNGSVPGPGAIRYYQYWYRDPGVGSPCGTGSNFSSGLAVTWQ